MQLKLILSCLTVVGALIAAASAPAVAADFPVLKAPALQPQALNWSGFYGGVHVGYGWGKKHWFDNFPTPDGELDAAPIIRGGLGGFQAGINHQIDRLVFGLEGDFSWSKINKKFNCFFFGDQICTHEAQWFGSIMGRLGLTHGPFLGYLKGGVAFTHDFVTDIATCAGSQPIIRAGIHARCGVPFEGQQTRIGWGVGGGLEYLLTRHWSLKAEYTYLNFGQRSITLWALDNDFFTEEIRQRMHLVKVGVNYHFHSDAPVAVRALGFAPERGAASRPSTPSGVVGILGVDVGKQSMVSWAGTVIAPFTTIDQAGLRILLLGVGGTYKYDGTFNNTKGIFSQGEALLGYAWKGTNYEASLYFGPNAEHHSLSRLDPLNSVQGTQFGAKVRGDVTIAPTANTFIHGEGDYSTAFNSFSVLSRAGVGIGGGAYVGPEGSFMGNDRFDQWRVGGHLTGVAIGTLNVNMDLSVGYLRDSTVGNGAYVRAEMTRKF
jgi:opacity protein-like surface antigen